jgi:capsular polysaccharide export protein
MSLSSYKFKGWGNKFSGKRAKFFARVMKGSYQINEDGFIAYINREGPLLSYVTDTISAYYETNIISDLENLIKRDLLENEFSRAQKLMKLFRNRSISKYNSEREFEGSLNRPYVLVVDQVFGDLSVECGMASPKSFSYMINSALNDFPNHHIIIKVHPDVYSRKKKGYIELKKFKGNSRIKIIAENCHPVRLITLADVVYTVTSQIGFEALIWGKKVKCFGMPFYAGWGLTEDVVKLNMSRKKVSLEQLVYSALVRYPIYLDPYTNKNSNIESIIEYISLQRKMRFRYPEKIYAYGFTPWKKSILKSFTQGSELIFLNRLKDAPNGVTLMVWGSLECNELDSSIQLIRVEDGFLRSVGLGGELIKPQSWVFDEIGIYYDSSKPSKLESILCNTKFEFKELERAKKLIEKIKEKGISKYNLGNSDLKLDENKKPCLLVVGQVETDASIRFGTGEVNTNLKLLRVVREKFPKACIVYKPHPDVVSGIRKKGENEKLERNFYDLRVEKGDAFTLFNKVDSVHTMTSLVGFEALLRNKKVYTYGMPFYAGWGLTIDLMNFERRGRSLSINELVAGTLIHYPTYISEKSKMYTTPEIVSEELIARRNNAIKKISFGRKVFWNLIKLWNNYKKM